VAETGAGVEGSLPAVVTDRLLALGGTRSRAIGGARRGGLRGGTVNPGGSLGASDSVLFELLAEYNRVILGVMG